MAGFRRRPRLKTNWGTVRTLSERNDKDKWEDAWASLYERYRPGLRSYARWLLTRAGGHALAENEADEVVDGFLAACAEQDWLSRAKPEYGRFRVFIRVLMARFVRDFLRKRAAQKRQPDSGPPVSLDALLERPAQELAGALDEGLNQEWAQCMLLGALERVRGRSERNARVVEHLLAHQEVNDEMLAAELSCEASQVALIVFRSRKMLAEELWEELKETVSDPRHLEEERQAVEPFLSRYLDRGKAPSFFGIARRPADAGEGEEEEQTQSG